MVGRGLLEAEHDRAQLRQAQPVRHDAAQDAALLEEAVARGGGALAGDHQHDLVAALARAMQEADERPMGLALAHAVEVDRAVGAPGAAPQRHQGLALDRGKRRKRGRSTRSAGRGRRGHGRRRLGGG